jgi:acyl-coenzyme A thioesterase PaaI-like protein
MSRSFLELHREAHADLPAPDAAWEARRRAAMALRRLHVALATRNGSAAALDALASDVEALAGELERGDELPGVLAHVQGGGMERFVAMTRELNPLSGLANPIAPPLEMWRDDSRAWGTVRFGWPYEGPPGTVHGGFIAATFDQFLGFAQGLGDGSGVTGKLEVRYARPTPLHVALRLEAELRERIGRLTYVQGRLLHDGVVTAKAKAMFVDVPALRSMPATE